MVSLSYPNAPEIVKLDGKVVVVTGASKGIGKAIASAFAAAGAKVVLAARTRETLEQVAAELRESGAEAVAVPTDVTDVDAVPRLIEQALNAYQRVDILVNNAGIGYFGPVVDFAPDAWDTVLNSNLKAIYLCAKYALPPMLAQGSGQIINVLSIAAKVAFEASAAYCAAKAGALALTKVLAAEVRQQNIRVTAVLPGSVHTPFWDDIPEHPDFEQMLKPEHVADTVVSVCQQPLGMVTEEIVVMPPLGIL
ncbi:SDR family NAD(P)-dependent oxidoreductase [Candidatus Poribacteria bacterium]|nr:SDR family NAD(P)-dependent oxidoreductase [Candidatus Poribacteria bacterium]MYG07872.1 SDR family NAD(P)-dependent oxidoreductase [Candidatus Poribacteria bacterium]MYK20926.1 SDR family NAD(P)-dependent oxidoreductase [Candidatus Poribacteria bacterium]